MGIEFEITLALSAQKLAADPYNNCWVSASAGTGKTKILIDRLARLLLLGFSPESILCITFTKAAANEMQERLLHKLQSWAIADQDFLIKELTDILGSTPSLSMLERAQGLFFMTLDTPGGLNIQTIHSFCQSLLQSFPLEADIDTCFELIEEETANLLLKKAFQETFENFPSHLRSELDYLTNELSDNRFEDILESLQNQRGQFYHFLHSYEDLNQYQNLLEKLLLKDLEQRPNIDLENIRKTLEIHGVPPVDPRMVDSLSQDLTNISNLSKIFLTKDGSIRQKLVSKRFENTFPWLHQELQDLANYYYAADQYAKNQRIIRLTLAFCQIANLIFDHYQADKRHNGLLDFEDLISITQRLLQEPGISDWVFYKLDGGFDHILIDEAQDTSYAQWQVLKALIEALLTPDAAQRTLFVVGDIKQSIYSFQGAKPLLFLDLQSDFQQYLKGQGRRWCNIELHVSFRTTPAVLEVIDQLFKRYPYGVQFNEEIKHVSYRSEHPGLVEIWPLVEAEEKIEYEPWMPPITQQPFISTGAKLAQQIAEKIEDLLKSLTVLPSTQKPVQPQDILILVKRRAEWIHSLLQQLKQRNIPVAGIDRLQLKDHIAVLDLLALGRFLCLPLDDYSLACVLKSPLINKGYGLTEEQLFELCHDREGTLWQSLLNNQASHSLYQEIVAFLKKWLSKVDFEDPFQLFHGILRETESQFIARLGEECQEILNEFLQQALNYQQTHVASLQGFIEFIDQQETDIKRSVSFQANQVRLMTIHGSKGLQAPIVILVDSGDQPSLQNELFLWHEKETPLFLLKPSLKDETEALAAIKAENLDKLAQEQRRLLYVALTRSQDQLYIAGLAKRSKAGEWYSLLTDTLQEVGVSTPEGGWRYQPSFFESAVPSEETQNSVELPIEFKQVPQESSWMTRPTAKSESNSSTPEQQRGILIHRLFEILGGYSYLTMSEDYKQTAQQWCLKNDKECLVTDKDLETIGHILTHSDYKRFFGPLSVAEVEVQNGDFLGRIDRLAVIDETVFILDYKTGSPPPKDDNRTPQGHSLQLQNYRQALAGIYKNYSVRTFLLWTEGPYLVEIY